MTNSILIYSSSFGNFEPKANETYGQPFQLWVHIFLRHKPNFLNPVALHCRWNRPQLELDRSFSNSPWCNFVFHHRWQRMSILCLLSSNRKSPLKYFLLKQGTLELDLQFWAGKICLFHTYGENDISVHPRSVTVDHHVGVQVGKYRAWTKTILLPGILSIGTSTFLKGVPVAHFRFVTIDI